MKGRGEGEKGKNNAQKRAAQTSDGSCAHTPEAGSRLLLRVPKFDRRPWHRLYRYLKEGDEVSTQGQPSHEPGASGADWRKPQTKINLAEGVSSTGSGAFFANLWALV